MYRLISVIILSVCVACGPVLAPPVLQPHTQPPVLGLNLGPERMTPAYLSPLASRPLRLRVPVHSKDEAFTVLDAVRPYPSLSVLLLVEHADLDLVSALVGVKEHVALAGIELGNELDLAGLTPQAFATFTAGAITTLRSGGWTAPILSGGIYTVDATTLSYAAPMLAQLPCDAGFAVHLYGDSSSAVLAALQQATGCHAIAITEFGMPSRTPAEDGAQLTYLREKLADFTTLGAASAYIYQLVSGQTDASNLDNFGLLRFDSSQKPAFSLLQH